MKIIWIVSLLIIQSYHTINSQLRDEYNQYSFYQKRPLSPRPLDAMADSTNDLGVCVLRIIAAGGAIGNIAFSPFGLMAVSVLLYEGSSGYSALQIKQSLNLPWEILAVRVGVRDLNRYLKTYFKSDGFLNGLTMSREEICLRPQFKQVLRLYGFDDPNSFLIDSCRQNTATMTTVKPTQPMSVTTHGTVVAEMTPTSQMIQVSTNLTNASTGGGGDASAAATTDRPAKVTYAADAVFTAVDKNTNSPMNSGTDTMVVDIETEPNVMPVEPPPPPPPSSSSSSSPSAGGTEAAPDGEPYGSQTAAADDAVVGASTTTPPIGTAAADPATTPIGTAAADPATTPASDSQMEQTIGGSRAAETSTERVGGTAITTDGGPAAATLVSSTSDNRPSVTQDAVVDVRGIGADDGPRRAALVVGARATTVEPGDATVTTVDDDGTGGATVTTVDDDGTGGATVTTVDDGTGGATVTTVGDGTADATVHDVAAVETVTPSASATVASTAAAEDADRTTAPGPDDGTTTSDEYATTTTTARSGDAAENEIGAESNRHYRVTSLENKSARSMTSADDHLPTFNVEFVVRKEDLRPGGCNRTRKRTIIKPDRVLTEYPKNSGVSITLRKSEKHRRRRHLEQYYGYNENRNQWYDGYKPYGHSPGWMDRSSDLFESTSVFNYRRIPFFTYTAVLPFGFIYELKSQVIEIPLDDPKYTLMILMPNHQDGLSELLLLLPTIPLRHIHNSLKPIAVHATIPTFKYTAKVDLTSALQQIGIRDVFYRYRADLSFMSPDARLFVSSVQQVVSVTAKKYNTPPVYEIQRKYVERDFVVSRPFVYFVMDIHTKVSLIAGVITDPLASPIWV